MYRVATIAFLCLIDPVSAQGVNAPDVRATVTIFESKRGSCAMNVAGQAPPRFDVPCSEVAMTLAQLGVPKGSAVLIPVLAAITKEQSAALHKQIEDAGYVIAKVKVRFLTEPPGSADR